MSKRLSVFIIVFLLGCLLTSCFEQPPPAPGTLVTETSTIFPSVSDTPQLTFTPVIPNILSSASEMPFTETPYFALTGSPVPSPTSTPSQTPTETPPPLEITSPKAGDSVGQEIQVLGVGASPALEPGTYLNIIVYAEGSSSFFVQPIPEIQPDGTWWSNPVNIGEGPAYIGMTFHVCAVLHNRQMPTGPLSYFPSGQKECVRVTLK